MRVIGAFLAAGIKIHGIAIVTDRDFKTTCATCGESQTLNQCSTSTVSDVTYYKCKNGCDKEIVLVYKFGTIKNSSGSAYRLKDYVVKSYSDLFIVMSNGALVQFPK